MVERIRTLLESRQLTPTQFADLIGVARPIVSHILSGRNKPSLEVVQRILAAMPELAMPWLLNGSGPMLAVPNASVAAAPNTAIPPVPAPSIAPTQLKASAAQEAEPLAYQQNGLKPQRPASAAPGNASIELGMAPVAASVAKLNKPAPFRPAAKPKRFVAQALAVKSNEAPTATSSKAGVPVPEPATGPVVTPEIECAAALNEEPIALTSEQSTTRNIPASAMADALFAGAEKPIRRIVIFYRDGSFADYQPE